MTENKPGREGNACNGDHCGMCCGGCCGCTMPELTREEADFLLTFAQLPFQPVVSRADLQRPVYAAESPSGEGDPAENISPETISSLADKYLIRIDYDIPLGNYSYRGFESYPLHGSMALTYRGQQVMDDLFRQDLDRSAE